MKKVLKIALIFILIITNSILTQETYVYGMGEILQAGNEFLYAGNNVEDTINTTALANVSYYTYNMFFTVAIAIAVIIGAFIGIKIMVGTVEEKAKMKEMLVPYIIGCVVIFSIFTIWRIVVEIGTDLVGTGEKTISSEKPTGG